MFHSKWKSSFGFLGELKSIGYSAIEIWSRDSGYEYAFEAARSKGLTIAGMVDHPHSLCVPRYFPPVRPLLEFPLPTVPRASATLDFLLAAIRNMAIHA